jgi:hypothetical protein
MTKTQISTRFKSVEPLAKVLQIDSGLYTRKGEGTFWPFARASADKIDRMGLAHHGKGA